MTTFQPDAAANSDKGKAVEKPGTVTSSGETGASAVNEYAEKRIEKISPNAWRLQLEVHTLPPYDHTNAYLIANAGVGLLVDPGAADERALRMIANTLKQANVKLLKGVLLTHTHPDHTGGVEGFIEWANAAGHTDLSVYVHANEAGRVPSDWNPVVLQGERTLMVGDVAVACLLTPGHSPGHLTLVLNSSGEDRPEAALVGDLAVDSGSVWVGHPEGDVAAYLNSLQRISALRPRVLGPGHGPAIVAVQKRLSELALHRQQREDQVLAALEQGQATSSEITGRIYVGHPPEVIRLAEQSVVAHLLKLMNELKVVHLGTDESGPYALRR